MGGDYLGFRQRPAHTHTTEMEPHDPLPHPEKKPYDAMREMWPDGTAPDVCIEAGERLAAAGAAAATVCDCVGGVGWSIIRREVDTAAQLSTHACPP